jgi:hypothetical protein
MICERDYPKCLFKTGYPMEQKCAAQNMLVIVHPSLCIKYSHGPEINQTRIEKQKHVLEKDYFLPQIIP